MISDDERLMVYYQIREGCQSAAVSCNPVQVGSYAIEITRDGAGGFRVHDPVRFNSSSRVELIWLPSADRWAYYKLGSGNSIVRCWL